MHDRPRPATTTKKKKSSKPTLGQNTPNHVKDNNPEDIQENKNLIILSNIYVIKVFTSFICLTAISANRYQSCKRLIP